jgi:hypothetical protein
MSVGRSRRAILGALVLVSTWQAVPGCARYREQFRETHKQGIYNPNVVAQTQSAAIHNAVPPR